MHIKKSWHRKSSNPALLHFRRSDESSYAIRIDSLPNLCSNIETLIYLGSAADDASISVPFSVQLNKQFPWQVLGLVVPSSVLGQVWRSDSPSSLLIEIFISLKRLGYEFETQIEEQSRSLPLTDQISGLWFGWRNFSRKAASRGVGTADSSSVLGLALEVLSDTMPRYAKWLAIETEPACGSRILEIGAGTGTMSILYQENCEVIAFEPAEETRKLLVENTAEFRNIRVVGSMAEAENFGPFDEALLINVLEHVERDVELLRDIRELLKVGGGVTILSPAHNMLYSNFDALIGHVRRYTKFGLSRSLSISGYTSIESRYFNAVGAIPWIIVNRWCGTISAKSSLTSMYDNLIVPPSMLIDRMRFRPFGQSVLAKAKRD